MISREQRAAGTGSSRQRRGWQRCGAYKARVVLLANPREGEEVMEEGRAVQLSADDGPLLLVVERLKVHHHKLPTAAHGEGLEHTG